MSHFVWPQSPAPTSVGLGFRSKSSGLQSQPTGRQAFRIREPNKGSLCLTVIYTPNPNTSRNTHMQESKLPCQTATRSGRMPDSQVDGCPRRRLRPTYKQLLRKEVIQPQVPLRLPCYDFTPVADLTVVGCVQKVRAPASGKTNSHGVTGGVYKARERIHRGMLIRDY